MPKERPNCVVAKKLYEAFLAGDLQAIYALLDPRVEWELVGPGEVPHFGLYRGLDEVKRFFSIIKELNRIASFDVLSCTEAEKGAYVECRERGDFEGHPMQYGIRSCQLLEIEDGRTVGFGYTRTPHRWWMPGVPDHQRACRSD